MKISILFIQTDPLPPGPIETNASFFHPQKLFLRWPKDNFNVNWYYIKINEHWEKVPTINRKLIVVAMLNEINQ